MMAVVLVNVCARWSLLVEDADEVAQDAFAASVVAQVAAADDCW